MQSIIFIGTMIFGMLMVFGVPAIVIIVIITTIKNAVKEEEKSQASKPVEPSEPKTETAGFDMQTFLGLKPRICEYCGGAIQKKLTKCQNCGADVKK